MDPLWQFLGHFLGMDNASGAHYLFWSGVGITPLVWIGAAWVFIRRHNCHVKGCPRVGKHPVAGTPFTVCGRHHPDVPDVVTHKHVLAAHRKAQREARTG